MTALPHNHLEKHYISTSQKDRILDYLLDKYQLDLTEYSEASVRRRLTKMLNEFNLKDAEQLEVFLSETPDGKQLFIEKFTVNVTEMFRDPHFYRALDEKVLPHLRHKDKIRIWSAGCSSGEEILSLTILMHELGLLSKCSILGTDLNPKMLDIARSRTYKIRHVRTYFKPYVYAGGKYGLEKYFTTQGDQAIFDPFLYENVRLQTCNLLGRLENEHAFDLVLCRNVLIYFKSTLQDKVIENLNSNLTPGGFLGLGSKESIIFYENKSRYKQIDLESKIYQKL